MGLVGEGQTRALKNVLVVETSQMPLAGFSKGGRSLVDMSGPATVYSPFGDMHNIVLIPHPTPAADKERYRLARQESWHPDGRLFGGINQRGCCRRNEGLRASCRCPKPGAQ